MNKITNIYINCLTHLPLQPVLKGRLVKDI